MLSVNYLNLMWPSSDSTNLPDLVVSQSDITVSPISGVGDSLAISAVVENKGRAASDTFSVRFYRGEPALGNTIGPKQMIPGLSAWCGSETLSDTVCVDSLCVWREKIYVVADCDSEIVEIYEDNNINWNWHSLYLFPVTQVGASSPAIANVAGDSDPEVIIAGNCWGKDGLVWSFSRNSSEVSSPAVGDIDDDGDQEAVLIFGDDSLFVYKDSTQKYAWSSGYSDIKIYGSAVLAYLDDNDTLDIVFGLSSRDDAQDINRVIALQAQGDSLKILWNKVLNADSTAGAILSPPAIGDVDSDGKQEVIVLSEDGFIYALNGENGDSVWVSQVGVNSASAPVMADLDEDGKLEIIVCTIGDSLFCLKGEDGQKEMYRSYDLGNVDKNRTPCLGDINGDGDLEVVFQADTTLFVLNFLLNLEKSVTIPEDATGIQSPVLADLNSDGSQEIVLAADDSLYILVANISGTLIQSFTQYPIQLAAEVSSIPALGDINGNGNIEIICSCQVDSQGMIHVYDYWTQMGDIDWGMYQHNCWRTGCSAQPISGTITEDLRWSGNVFISGDVIIPDSVKLTILPDSHVEFDTTDSEISGEDTTKCELIVYGQLHAVGTDGHGIEFTSHAYPPATSDWYAISLWDTASNSSQIEYCDINYAYKGISCYQCSIDVLNSSISHCSYGAYVDSSGTKLLLDHVRVDSCSYGVHVHQGAVRLDSSEFKYNDYGVKCEDFTRYDENMSNHYPDFQYCEIDSNDEAGVLLDDSSPIINYCSISYNKKLGIQCLGASDPILGQNTVTDNGSAIPPIIYGTGMYTTGTSSPIVFDKLFPAICHYEGGYNVITNNDVEGIRILQNSYPQLGRRVFLKGQNSIHGNVLFNVSNQNDSLVYARYNYWGATPETTKINGSVDWKPYLSDTTGGKGFWRGDYLASMDRSSRRDTDIISRAASKEDDLDSNAVAWEYNELGTDYLMQGMYAQAIGAFQYVIDTFAHLKAANYALVHIILCYKETDDDDQIVFYLEDLASDCTNPELEDLAWYMSISQLCREKNYQYALNRCQWLVSGGCPSEMEKGLRLKKGLIYRYGLGDDLAAMTVFQDFIRRYPDDALIPVARVELEILGYNSDLPKSPTGDPVIKPAVSVPKKFTLYQNYPNPFNAYTSIRYDLPEDSRVSMKIFNILGQRVVTLVHERQSAGNYIVSWDGTNSMGSEVSSGIYFIRMEAGDFSRTRKLVLLR